MTDAQRMEKLAYMMPDGSVVHVLRADLRKSLDSDYGKLTDAAFEQAISMLGYSPVP